MRSSFADRQHIGFVQWVLTLGKWSAGIIFTIGALLSVLHRRKENIPRRIQADHCYKQMALSSKAGLSCQLPCVSLPNIALL